MVDYMKEHGLSGLVKKTRGRPTPRGSSKGKGDLFFPSDEYSQRVRLFAGNYTQLIYDDDSAELREVTLPYYIFRGHFIPGRRNRRKAFLVCSAGPDPYNPKPCVPCDEYGRDDPESFRPTRNVFNLLCLEWFHRTPWIKKGETDPVMSKKTGEAVLIDKLCEGDNCPMCKAEDEKFFGKPMYWELSDDQLGQIMAKEEMHLHKKCVCGKTMNIERFLCSRCDTPLIVAKTTDLSEREVKRLYKEGMICDECKTKVDLVPKMKCSCEEPRPLNVFMVDMDISYLKSTSNKKTYDLEIEFHPPDSEREEDYMGEMKPFDFASICAPLSPIEQRKACGLPSKGRSHAVDYDTGKDSKDDAENPGSYNG